MSDEIHNLIDEVPNRGRPRSQTPRVQKRLTLRTDLIERVERQLARPGFEAQPSRGIPDGAWRNLIERLLTEWLNEREGEKKYE